MGDFLTFRRMVTPWVIVVLFVATSVVCVAVGAFAIGRGLSHHDHQLAYAGLLILLLGPLISRLYSEFLVVIFRINETLTDLREVADWSAQRAYTQDLADSEDEEDEAEPSVTRSRGGTE